MLWGNTSFVNHLEVWTGLFSNFAQFFFKHIKTKLQHSKPWMVIPLPKKIRSKSCPKG